jgi:hypothetical protein
MSQPASDQNPDTGQRHRRLLATAGAVAIAGTMALTASAAAHAAAVARPAVPGIEHVQIMSASTSPGPASAIAYGAFTAGGTARIGSAPAGELLFRGGTIRLRHHAGRPTVHFSPVTCLTMISQPGTYAITGGTGRYAGISGHGTYQLSFTFIGARGPGGCTAKGAPVAQQELLRLAGPVRW